MGLSPGIFDTLAAGNGRAYLEGTQAAAQQSSTALDPLRAQLLKQQAAAEGARVQSEAAQTRNLDLAAQQKQLELNDIQIQGDAMKAVMQPDQTAPAPAAGGNPGSAPGAAGASSLYGYDPMRYSLELMRRGALPATVTAAQNRALQMTQDAFKLTTDQRNLRLEHNKDIQGPLEGYLQQASDPQATNDQLTYAWNSTLQAINGIDPQYGLMLARTAGPNTAPKADLITPLLYNLGSEGYALDRANNLAKLANTNAEERLRGSQAGEADARAAQANAEAAKANEETRNLKAQQMGSRLAMAARRGPDALAAQFAQEQASDPATAAQFAGETDPQRLMNLGMNPEQITKSTEEARHNKVLEDVEKGRLSVEQAAQRLKDKEFLAKYGTPEARSMFTKSVIADPDSYFSLPAEMKPGVAMDLVAQGYNVPTQLPSDVKSRATSAGWALNTIARVRELLNDPEVHGNGPIAGRVANIEQDLGTTFAGETPSQARKEQELRTDMVYLSSAEAKAVFGSRPAARLVELLRDASANPHMDWNLINGALDAMQTMAGQAKDQARAYSFGGAEAAATARQTPPPPPAAGGPRTILVTAPDGSKHYFETQDQANEFKRLAGIK